MIVYLVNSMIRKLISEQLNWTKRKSILRTANLLRKSLSTKHSLGPAQYNCFRYRLGPFVFKCSFFQLNPNNFYCYFEIKTNWGPGNRGIVICVTQALTAPGARHCVSPLTLLISHANRLIVWDNSLPTGQGAACVFGFTKLNT